MISYPYPQATVIVDWTYCGLEMSAEVVVRYLPGRPGVLHGPPERCYPDEPLELVDVLSCTLLGVGGSPVRERMDPSALPDALLQKIEQQLAELDG
jgi:hypothetical protein